ncbi:hypothetical protein Tco_1555857 [Tanacetum coccineum]
MKHGDLLSEIVKDNKRSRTNALKAELRALKLGDQTMEAYFQKIESIDFLTRRVLLRCDSTGDLYPVTAPSPIPHAFLVSQHTWHQRLGHPGSEVLRRLVSSNVISLIRDESLYSDTNIVAVCGFFAIKYHVRWHHCLSLQEARRSLWQKAVLVIEGGMLMRLLVKGAQRSLYGLKQAQEPGFRDLAAIIVLRDLSSMLCFYMMHDPSGSLICSALKRVCAVMFVATLDYGYCSYFPPSRTDLVDYSMQIGADVPHSACTDLRITVGSTFSRYQNILRLTYTFVRDLVAVVGVVFMLPSRSLSLRDIFTQRLPSALCEELYDPV